MDKTPQKTLLRRRIKALKISVELIDNTILNLMSNEKQEITTR